jgi:hypothetical protein
VRAFQRVGVDTTSDGAAVADLHDPRESLHRELGSRAVRGRRCVAALQVGRCKEKPARPTLFLALLSPTVRTTREATRETLPEPSSLKRARDMGGLWGGGVDGERRWEEQNESAKKVSALLVHNNLSARTSPARQRARRSLHARRQAIAEGPSPADPSSLGSSLLRRPVPARPFQLVTRKPCTPKHRAHDGGGAEAAG